jgi:hypothetical protein
MKTINCGFAPAPALKQKSKFRILTKLAAITACACILNTTTQATTVLLGLVYSAPSQNTSGEANYVNTLVDMANGGIAADPYFSSGITFDLRNNPILNISDASPYGADDHAWSANVMFPTGSGFSYVTTTYGIPNTPITVKAVYYSDTGAFSIPHHLQGTDIIQRYTAFRTTDTDGLFRPAITSVVPVPEGGSSIALLGFTALSFAALRRKLTA